MNMWNHTYLEVYFENSTFYAKKIFCAYLYYLVQVKLLTVYRRMRDIVVDRNSRQRFKVYPHSSVLYIAGKKTKYNSLL